jgi:hypothetical protein
MIGSIDLLRPENRLFCVEFSRANWSKLLGFWQKYGQRIEELSGLQRHLMVPMVGLPALNLHQWRSAKAALLLAARSNQHHRQWVNEAVGKIDQGLQNP